jgi:hypothetical protein
MVLVWFSLTNCIWNLEAREWGGGNFSMFVEYENNAYLYDVNCFI